MPAVFEKAGAEFLKTAAAHVLETSRLSCCRRQGSPSIITRGFVVVVATPSTTCAAVRMKPTPQVNAVSRLGLLWGSTGWGLRIGRSQCACPDQQGQLSHNPNQIRGRFTSRRCPPLPPGYRQIISSRRSIALGQELSNPIDASSGFSLV
jgi:hypothetical protein